MKKASPSEKMTRTSVTIPRWVKEEMDKVDINWSAAAREAIRLRLENEREKDVVEAVLLNEKLKRKVPKVGTMPR